jgi:hypothetical protein
MPMSSANVRSGSPGSRRYSKKVLCDSWHTRYRMNCDERSRLLERCATTMHAYTKASIKWQELTGKANTQEYRDSRDAREQARIQVDLARYELETHEGVHQCYPATPN